MKTLFIALMISLSGCSVFESLTCEIGGWEPDEIEQCNPEWERK